ncbi:hypothetical protein [Ramlibacter montanisoli]|uniref:Uncharacterized protein n=1 Tax=Ramlibacter montanisoli TaxID=2732512 RepID=A0A849K649_9BURK|nr:hypothetical protein [Ramlibacter montanisoli]NNU43902.1 hypothetical protein [Ramlibacter montanisoli]
MNFIQLTAAASLLIASGAMAAPAPAAGERTLSDTGSQTLLARETESGDDRRGRGRGRDDPKATEQAPATTIARETESGDDRGGRGRGRGRDDATRGGHKAFEEAPVVIAREAERDDDHGDDGDEFEIDDHA